MVWRTQASDWAMAQTDWRKNKLWVDMKKNTLTFLYFHCYDAKHLITFRPIVWKTIKITTEFFSCFLHTWSFTGIFTNVDEKSFLYVRLYVKFSIVFVYDGL